MKYFVFFISFFLLACGTEQVQKKQKSDIAQLSEQLLQNPNDIALLQKRKQLFLDRGNLEAAMMDQELIVSLDSSNHELLFELAEMQYQIAKNGRPNYYKASLKNLTKDLEAQESHTSSLLLRGELHFLYRNHEQSLKDLNNVLRVDPYEAKAYYFKGLNFKELGDFEKAISQLQTSVEQDPFNIYAYEELAFIYAYLDNPIAELYFDNALSLDSLNVQIWYRKGKYLQDLDRFSDAEKCYNAMLRIDNFNQFANYNLGYINWKRKDYEMAANYFSDAIYTNPEYVDAYFARGLCFKELGNIPQARADFQSALRLDENDEQAKIELNNLP
ncbi:MAG: hypothetical protein CMP66_07160 [Flavobacteriales bacterium]|nr:hypothetical protein [Flavobacteriales bacterium]|tara:strand:- start:994 stop:1983 length:990 start_codon:yes stop_codon:yes gene_type:complete